MDYNIKKLFESRFDLFFKLISGKSLMRIFLIYTLIFLLVIVTGIRFFNQSATIGLISLVIATELFYSAYYLLNIFRKANRLWRGGLELTLKSEAMEFSFNEHKLFIEIESINKISILEHRLLVISYGKNVLKLPFNDRSSLDDFTKKLLDYYPERELNKLVFEETLRGKLQPLDR